MTPASEQSSAALNVEVRHGATAGFALDVSIAIPLRGITALYGPSGSGKTTILDTIAGLRGDLSFARVSVGSDTWQDESGSLPPWKRQIGYVFQDARLLTDRSVAANLSYAQRRASPGGPEREAVVHWLGIASLLDREPASLSAGEQQRVAIARALLRNPRLLLLDEPFSNLDARAAAACMDTLVALERETRLPMLYVSHTLEEIHALADRVLIIDGGRITAEGPLLELASSLESTLARGAAAAAIVEIEPTGATEEDGLRAVAIDGQILWIGAECGDDRIQRLRIPARDVSVCRERPRASSILNVLEVTLADMKDLGEAHCLLRLRLGKQHLLARITRRSRRDLGLAAGDHLFAQIKSTALLGDRGRS